MGGPAAGQVANRLAQLGLVFLALGVVCSIMLVVDLAISRAPAVFWACAAGVLLAVLWGVLPVVVRRTGAHEER